MTNKIPGIYLTDRDLWEISPEIRNKRTFVHLLGSRLRRVYKDHYAEFPSWCKPEGYMPEGESGWDRGLIFFNGG